MHVSEAIRIGNSTILTERAGNVSAWSNELALASHSLNRWTQFILCLEVLIGASFTACQCPLVDVGFSRIHWEESIHDAWVYLHVREFIVHDWNSNSALRFLIPSSYTLHHPHILAYSTWYFQGVNHISTEKARSSLTSVFGLETSVTTWCSHNPSSCVQTVLNTGAVALNLYVSHIENISTMLKKDKPSNNAVAIYLAHHYNPKQGPRSTQDRGLSNEWGCCMGIRRGSK